MRVLVSVNDAVGHVLPLLPLVRALRAKGHEVLLASPGSQVARLAAIDGVRVLGLEPTSLPPVASPPGRHDRAGRLRWAVERSWPNAARGWAAPLLQAAHEWRPDLVVVEPVEHAGRLVAAALDVPLVEHGWGFTLPDGSDSAAAAGLLDLYETHHTAPVLPVLRLDVGPHALQADDIPPAVERHRYQPWSPDAPPLAPPSDRPRVLVTLGTFENEFAAERLRTAVEAAASLPVEVVVTLGHADRGGREGFPSDVVVTDWLDLAGEVRRCAAVVHHAGAGSSLTTACAGIPAVCLPQGADQFRNSALLAAAGAARVVVPDDLSSATVIEALDAALHDPSIRAAARRLAQANAELPALEMAIERLEQLTG